jgi:hypothetical protein
VGVVGRGGLFVELDEVPDSLEYLHFHFAAEMF